MLLVEGQYVIRFGRSLLQNPGVQTGSGMAEGGPPAGRDFPMVNEGDADAPLAAAIAALSNNIGASIDIYLYIQIYMSMPRPASSKLEHPYL